MKIDILTKEDLEEIKSLLHEVLPLVRQMKSEEQRKWKRGKEVQELLGISNTKLNDLRNRGKLTFTQFGNMYYYDSESINEELNRNRVKCRDCA
jgi:uncharacterized protein YacL (UPF0231 family)